MRRISLLLLGLGLVACQQPKSQPQVEETELSLAALVANGDVVLESPPHVPRRVDRTDPDSTPTDAAGQYRRAFSLKEEALQIPDDKYGGKNYDKVELLEESVRMYLLAARTMPQEVKSDFEVAAKLLLDADSLNKKMQGYLLASWDYGENRGLVRPMLETYVRRHLKSLRAEGFDPSLRYRSEDIYRPSARNRKDPFSCSMGDPHGSVISLYEISRTGLLNKSLWRRHYVDLMTTDHTCEGTGSEVTEDDRRKGYEEYMNMNLVADARRVAREGASENLSDFGDGVFSEATARIVVEPGDSAFLKTSRFWLERTTPADKRKLLLNQVERTEHFKHFGPASILYEMLGDSVNARRMRLLSKPN
jgi:hypothetical protein